MNYQDLNGVKTITCNPDEFSVVLVNKAKKNITSANTYVNANFFASGQKYQGKTPAFTLPVNHIICDYENTVVNCRKMDEIRGKFVNGKYYYDSYNYGAKGDQFYQKSLTTFYIKNGIPRIEDMATLDTSCTYAVAGIPIMKGGEDVKWLTYVKPQGWTGGELYATYHIFLGLKAGSNVIYIMNWRSTTSNMIYSGAAYKKFKALGFTDVIKLDGGGSCIMKYNGTVKQQTSENRQINAIIKVTNKTNTTLPQPDKEKPVTQTPANTDKNPYKKPTRNLNRYMTGDDVRWVQFQLQKAGVDCGAIDGSYGNGTYTAIKRYQKLRKLDVDGSCGPKTRESLANE